MARRRRRSPRIVAAMALGVLLGVALLASLRPGSLEPTEPAPDRVSRQLEVVRPAPLARPVAPSVALQEGHPELPSADPVQAPDVVDESMVLVDVVDAEGRPTEGARIAPVDCPGFARAGQRGAYRANPGRCTLRAFRRDGALFAKGPEASIDVAAGDVAYLQLELASARTGGIGVRFQPGPDGMRVLEVVDGTPAAEAGLEVGDLIVAVGDVDVTGFEAEDFVQVMTGPEGSEVDFTISYSDEEGEAEESLRVTRRFLDG